MRKALFVSVFAGFGLIGIQSAHAHPDHGVQEAYGSQEECEAETGRECGYVMCDYIPAGKTFEDVCGEGFEEGWQMMLHPHPEAADAPESHDDVGGEE